MKLHYQAFERNIRIKHAKLENKELIACVIKTTFFHFFKNFFNFFQNWLKLWIEIVFLLFSPYTFYSYFTLLVKACLAWKISSHLYRRQLFCWQVLVIYIGHAFEARIYAENVLKGFLPATGVLHHYRPIPATAAGVVCNSQNICKRQFILK